MAHHDRHGRPGHRGHLQSSHFNAHLAFHLPPGALSLIVRRRLGAGLVIAIYDFLGYFTVAYMGDEIKQPGPATPKAIVLSVLGVMGIYLAMNIGILARDAVKAIMNSKFIGSTS